MVTGVGEIAAANAVVQGLAKLIEGFQAVQKNLVKQEWTKERVLRLKGSLELLLQTLDQSPLPRESASYIGLKYTCERCEVALAKDIVENQPL